MSHPLSPSDSTDCVDFGQAWDPVVQREALGKVASLFGDGSEDQASPPVEITQENEAAACEKEPGILDDNNRVESDIHMQNSIADIANDVEQSMGAEGTELQAAQFQGVLGFDVAVHFPILRE